MALSSSAKLLKRCGDDGRVIGNAVVDMAYQVGHLPGPDETVLICERTASIGFMFARSAVGHWRSTSRFRRR
jgi:hypothetical protein